MSGNEIRRAAVPPIRRAWIFFAVIVAAVALLAGNSFAQSSLPPDVQADVLKRRIYDAAQRGDLKTTLSALDDYHKLPVAMPAPLLFLEAKAAWALKDPIRALSSLEAFLKVGQRGDPQYNEALALYDKYAAGAQAAKSGLAATRKAEAMQKLPGLLAEIQRNMRTIPAGTFQMGANHYLVDTRPVHTVAVTTFELGAYEITIGQYETFCKATDRRQSDPAETYSQETSSDWLADRIGQGRGNWPVYYISWNDAQAFIAWINQQTGLRYRLPSEAEWEYAAVTGMTMDNVPDDTSARDVGSFPANNLGIYDMLGGVEEWVEDRFHLGYEGAPQDGTAWVSAETGYNGVYKSKRVARGGGAPGETSRIASRSRLEPDKRSNLVGFRLARSQ